MKRWIVIIISAVVILAMFRFLATRGKEGGMWRFRKCSGVTRFGPSGPVEDNAQPLSDHVYVVPKEGECK
jgi:hypothetical protein